MDTSGPATPTEPTGSMGSSGSDERGTTGDPGGMGSTGGIGATGDTTRLPSADTGRPQQTPERAPSNGAVRPRESAAKGAQERPGVARLLAVGVGGAGTNAINHMIEAGVAGVEFLVMNTDAQALGVARTPN